MNRIILLGRLTREPEVKVTSSDKTTTTFGLAVDRPFKNREGKTEADFVNIVTWNKTAEVAGNYLHKGERCLVEGRLQIRSYEGKDGQKHYVTEVVADRLELIEKKKDSSSQKQGFESMGDDITQDVQKGYVTFDEEVPF